MAVQPADPDPEEIPGLERGGGVAPGDTPPASDSMSSLSEPKAIPRRRNATELVSIIVVATIAIAFAALAVGMVLDIFGWFH